MSLRSTLLHHLQNPPSFCLCHVSVFVETLRVRLIEALEVKQ